MSAVGFAPTDPIEELRRTYKAVQELRKTLKNARKAFDSRRLKELDTALMNAWLISTEIEDRLVAAGQRFTETQPR